MTCKWRGAGLWVASAAMIGLLSVTACGGATAHPTPQSTAQLLSAGLAAQAAGRTQTAIDDYQAVLKQEPGNKYALYNLGLIDQQQSKTAAAEAEYRAALVSDPNYVPALFNLAILRTGTAPYEAIDLYRHIIALQSSYAEAHLNLGYVLRSIGQMSEGNAEIAQAVALKPSLRTSPSATATPAA